MIKRRDFLRTILMTGLALFVMFIILFPVYYIFTVSIKPVSTLATTEIELIPKNVTLDAYKDVLFGFQGSKLVGNFSGTISGLGEVKNGRLIIRNAEIEGVIKKGPFTILKFRIPVPIVSGSTQSNENLKGEFRGRIEGVLTITKINRDSSIGFGIIKDAKVSGSINGNEISGVLRPIIVRNKGEAKLTNLGKFVNSVFFHHLKNSLILALLTVTLTLLFVVPAAYAFSRLKFFGREHVLYFYLMFTQVAGGLGIAGLIALYGIMVKLGLFNKLPALALVYAAGSVPFNTWLLKSYIDSINPDFDEAALIDGATYLQIIRYVLLPMALPGIATVAVMSFIGGWTEFILASLLLEQANQPLSVWIYTLMGGIGRGIDWNYFAAATLLFALPVFVMFMLAQKYIRSGLTLGGLKE
ncbi:sugar ABC transporter permease [Pyrococcus abyssi]|uniref:MalG maltose transport system permease protein n=1 Tax=Pyrococcus abyssi (strain GE5 / Orsay) TaxID=272844 RepID=Q9V295_PYRAB|nr:sugar ABC transporter permease [Pyrococcus abyssi]CAB49103.1 malG maltose transport system permease protein [Pyrococcus abyssi GE5]CCE69555.1 TPA: maltose transport system permease protein malg [Pyrococcus abyssi GE5]